LPGGWRFATEVEVKLEDSQIVRSDVSGWRRERLPELPEEVPITVVPDWVCEILSTNRSNDLVKRAYHRHRVGHYWLVDPREETLSVLRWSPEGYLEVLNAERSETVRAEPFVEMELRIGVLFGADEDE
jgi:Uma2 family endonuclease